MRLHRTLVLGASLLMAFSWAAVGEASTPDVQTAQASTAPAGGTPVTPAALPSGPVGDGAIKIGSNAFPESEIMAELYAQSLEAAGLTVQRKLDVGTRDVTWPAMLSGADINLMPEYIGSLLENKLNNHAGEASGDASATRAALAARLAPLDMSVLAATPGVDTNAFVVTQATADQYHLKSIGDLVAVQGDLVFGVPPECAGNVLCGGALARYGVDLGKVKAVTELAACGGEMATAIVNGGVQVGELCSTQADIALNSLVVLTDDLATQPADAVAPVVRNDLLRALDAQGVDIAAVLDPVSAAITTEDLTAFNLRIGVNHEDVDAVAKDYLTSKGLLGDGSATASTAP